MMNANQILLMGLDRVIDALDNAPQKHYCFLRGKHWEVDASNERLNDLWEDESIAFEDLSDAELKQVFQA